MCWICTLMMVALAASGRADEAEPKAVTFAKGDLGKVPAGWTAAKTGKGEGSVWKVVADKTVPSKSSYALAQTARGPGPLFNLCVADKASHGDVVVSVAFKAVEGEKDQGGGVVWRYQDANNYYVARFNPLEDNLRLYKVVAGKRTQLETREGLKAPAGEWHTLKVRHVGDRIECRLDDKKQIEANDDAIARAGKVGLWTKADAWTYFDNFRARPAK